MIKLNSEIKFVWVKSIVYYGLALIILLLIVKLNHLQAQLLSICLMVFNLIISSIHTFCFTVEKDSIEIWNRLKPLYKKKYDFSIINNIEIKGVVNKGITLAIDLKVQPKKYFAVTNIKEEELQRIVDAFKRYKGGTAS